MNAPSIHIGTSGWHYEHWRGSFYPPETEKKDFLAHYVTRFRTVEINSSFYRLPSISAVETWKSIAPDGFLFAVKASRYITHMKKLKDGRQAFAALAERVSHLGNKLGPILFQLPPRWRFNGERLGSFLRELPAGHHYAFEFRDKSWFNDEAYELLVSRNAAFCIYELADLRSPRLVTADFVYLRLHGPGGPYQGQYDDQTLGAWADAMAEWSRQGRQIYCYFDNDQAGYAAQDALRLQRMVNGTREEG